MTNKSRKTEMNIALKVAMVESRQTARRISIRTRIPEQRLSSIVHNKVIATDDERAALAKFLHRDVEDLFPSETAAV